MELRQLTYFLAVADHGTVTAAAEALHLAQPSLSVQLQQLEAELACPLFDRSGRRLRLTAAGAQFYQRASAILSMCDSARLEMADLGRGAAGTLRLGAVSSVSSTRFLTWLEGFRTCWSRSVPGRSSWPWCAPPSPPRIWPRSPCCGSPCRCWAVLPCRRGLCRWQLWRKRLWCCIAGGRPFCWTPSGRRT